MRELIDYRDETPDEKHPNFEGQRLIVFRVRQGKQIDKYGAWVTEEMANDEVILKPFLLQAAKMLNENKEIINQERVFAQK